MSKSTNGVASYWLKERSPKPLGLVLLRGGLLVLVLALLPACGTTPAPTSTGEPAPVTTFPSTPSAATTAAPPLPTPTPTAPPTATPLPVDLSATSVRYADRPAWQAFLGWSDECEAGFQLIARQAADDGGIVLYPAADGRTLVFVACTLGLYWTESGVYLVDTLVSPPAVRLLTVPELTGNATQGWVAQEVALLHGLPDYDPETQTLINFQKARGMGDCGAFYQYHFEQDRFVLEQAQQHECNDAFYTPANEWEVVYRRSGGGGPALVYRTGDDGQTLAIVAADGSGKKLYPLPAGATVGPLAQAVSLDGRWLAFHTGAAGIYGTGQTGVFDLALNLLDLTAGQTQPLTALLGADYPANFRQVAEALAQQGVTLVAGADPVITAGFLQEAFERGIGALAWSPDGRYLAFAGQMGGPSSDLYLYDGETQAIRRLDDDLEQIQSVAWSPDGQWILYGSQYVAGAGEPINYHAATVEGSTRRALSSSVIGLQGWLAPATYLQSQASNGPAGTFNLQSIEIATGITRTLWSGTFQSWAVDPGRGLLAVRGSEGVGTTQGGRGLFLVNLADGSWRQVGQFVSSVTFLGAGERRFLFQALQGEQQVLFYLLADGSAVEAPYDPGYLTGSPDGRYLLWVNQELRVYTPDQTLVRTLPLPLGVDAIHQVIWRPDSAGFFLRAGTRLYAADLLDGGVTLVDETLVKGALDFRWSAEK